MVLVLVVETPPLSSGLGRDGSAGLRLIFGEEIRRAGRKAQDRDEGGEV